MPYIGNQPGTGVRNRFIYTATASQTTFSGADDNGKTLKYADSDFVDVFLNGVCLVPAVDYTSTTKTSVVLTQAASLNDTLEVVAYDIATIADTVSKADGGTFEANVTFADGADIITASKGTDNVRLGENAGAAIASGGNQNTLIGKDAGTSITTGVENTLVGYRAGDAITDADFNVGVGWGALGANVLGSKSVAMGTGALDAQNPASATDMHNTAVGHGAGGAVTTATRNTAVGSSAGASNQTSLYNTYVGYGAGENTTGQGNTFIGDVSGNSVVAGEFNTLLGQQAGNAMTSGSKNTVIGRYNGNQNSLDFRTSSNNIVLSDGDGNPRGFFGHVTNSGDPSWTLQNDLGQWTVINKNTHGSNPYGILIQYTGASPNGNGNEFIYCYDSTPAARMVVRSNGDVRNVNNVFAAISDIKLKENIADADSQWDDIKAVQVKKYSLKADDLDAPNMIGVIAQDLETAGMNGLVDEEVDRDIEHNDLGTTTKSVKYSILYMKAIKALQEAMTRIEALETENTAIKARLDALEAG